MHGVTVSATILLLAAAALQAEIPDGYSCALRQNKGHHAGPEAKNMRCPSVKYRTPCIMEP